MNDTIYILDVGLSGLNVFTTLSKTFPKETFIYQNNLKYYPYSERPESEIKQLVAADINQAIESKPAFLIIVSDIIIEHGEELLQEIKIPFILIDDIIVDYVNTNYEQKNMLLLARKEIIDANLYQKRFIYDRLYSIASDDLGRLIERKMTKTSESFQVTSKTLLNVIKKDIDVIITSSPYLINLRTEIREYVDFSMITDIGTIIANKLNTILKDRTEKRRGERIVKSSVPSKSFKEKAYWCDVKYRVREY